MKWYQITYVTHFLSYFSHILGRLEMVDLTENKLSFFFLLSTFLLYQTKRKYQSIIHFLSTIFLKHIPESPPRFNFPKPTKPKLQPENSTQP